MFRALPGVQDFPDARADISPGHPQECTKLPRERAAVGILQGRTGTDRERHGIREACRQIVQHFLLPERLVHAEKRRHRKACLPEQEEISGL